jgi:gas vesicle protein
MFLYIFWNCLCKRPRKKVTDKAANTLCTCVNEQLDKLNPAIKQMIIDMAEQGQEKAQANLAKVIGSMTPDEQTKFYAGMEDMQKPAFQEGFSKCFDDFKKITQLLQILKA